jgi:tetratricopeptide (TPR) repeat protein
MMMVQGESLVALDQQAAAAARFRQATQIDAHPGMAYMRLCGAEYNAGRVEEALAACDQAAASDPSRPEFYQTKASIQMNLGRYEEAIRTYEKGLQVAESKVGLSRYYHSNINSVSSAKVSGARAEMERMGQVLLSLGYAYFQLKDYKHAAEAFERSARLHPYPSLAWFNLCATLYDMDDLLHAASACENATQWDAAMADAYFVKASALYGEAARHGRTQVTRPIRHALEKYLELAPEGSYAGEARGLLRGANSN